MSERFSVVVLAGEGVGPEVTAEAVRVLHAAERVFGLPLQLSHYDVGQPAQARTGSVFPPDVEAACTAAAQSGRGAILFGAVADEPIGILRKQYDLFANLRPVRVMPPLRNVTRLKREHIERLDFLVVRELVSDIYYGRCTAGADAAGRWAAQEMYYHEREIRRIVRVGLEQARARRKQLVLVHKANVIKDVFGLWLEILRQEARAYPDVACSDILVDNMAMQLILRPADFDVVLCPNLFGDILSDLGAGLVGSLGLMPSASINERGFALYEPVGGTAPDIAGQNKANPVASILSAAMLCRHTLRSEPAAHAIEQATEHVLRTHRTADVYEAGCERVSTAELGRRIAARLCEMRSGAAAAR